MHRDNPSLFDHLTGGGKDRLRDRKPQGFCGLEINDQFKLGWLNYRQIGGLRPSENPTAIDASLAICVKIAGPITRQAPGYYELTRIVNCGDTIARRQSHEL